MASGTATEQLSRIDDNLATLVAQGVYMKGFIEFAYLQFEEKINFLMNETQFMARDTNSFPGLTVTLLELLGQNGSINAQNAQTLQLASFGACCDVIELPLSVPDDLCQRAQAVFDIVAQAADKLCELQATAIVPDATVIREMFNYPTINPRNPYLITEAEANAIMGYIAQRGNSGLGALCDLNTRTSLIFSYLGLFVGSPLAADVKGKIDGNLLDTSEIDLGMAGIIKLLLSASIVRLIYDSEIDVQAGSYDAGACGDTPPVEWEYTNNFNRLITDVLVQTSNGTLCFGAGETECVGTDYIFELVITSACASFAGANFLSKPDFSIEGTVAAVNDTASFVTGPDHEGFQIVWFPMPEGETCYVEYSIRARPYP